MTMLFRFFIHSTLRTFTMDELLAGVYPDLVGAPVMVSAGVKVGDQTVFAEDILVLDTTVFDESKSFWNSNLGQKMKERKFDQVVMHISQTDRNEISFRLYIKKDGRFVTDNEYQNVPLGAEDYASGNGIFSTYDTGRAFIRYFCLNNPEIVGNTYFNPELLPGKD